MSSKINLLLEKYLNTYRWDLMPSVGILQDTDVFVNPSRKDFVDAMSNEDQGKQESVRFMADSDTMNVYIWGAYLGLHHDIWKHLHKDGLIKTELYKSPNLMVGVYNPKTKKVEMESKRLYVPHVWQRIKDADWTWADKYIPNVSGALEKEK